MSLDTKMILLKMGAFIDFAFKTYKMIALERTFLNYPYYSEIQFEHSTGNHFKHFSVYMMTWEKRRATGTIEMHLVENEISSLTDSQI